MASRSTPNRATSPAAPARRPELRFLARFALFFGLAQGVYALAAPALAPVIQETLTARPAAWLLALAAPADQPRAEGFWLHLDQAAPLAVGAGCEAVGAMLLLASALLATSLPLARRLAVMAAGTGVLYLVNLGRIAALALAWKHAPALFESLHVYAGQGLVVFAALALFLILTARPGGTR